MKRLRVIGLIGAGAISSATICSLYLAYTLSAPANQDPVLEPAEAPEVKPQTTASQRDDRNQAYLVGFLADADPQVRTLAAWGLASDGKATDRQREIVRFVRQEKDPAVRTTLYRYLHGQNALNATALAELVREEENLFAWLAGCDLLAAAVKAGTADEKVERFFNNEIVPVLKKHGVHSNDLTCKIASIIALRRAGTAEALRALETIAKNSADDQVVAAASSAFRLASHGQSFELRE